MGVDPTKWGPGAWRFLHNVTLLFPDAPSPSKSRPFRKLFRLLPTVLPCGNCRAHLRQTYRRLPPDFRNRAVLVRWIYKVHERTNVDLHKKLKRPTFQKEIAGIKAGWQAGLRDLAFSAIFNASGRALPSGIRQFFKVARAIVGSHHLPTFSKTKSKVAALNKLASHFRMPKSAVLAKYRPWLTKRDQASSGLALLSAVRPRSSNGNTTKSSASSRRRASHRRRS